MKHLLYTVLMFALPASAQAQAGSQTNPTAKPGPAPVAAPSPSSSQSNKKGTTTMTSPMTMEQGLTMHATDENLRPTMMAFIEAASNAKANKVAAMISAKMRTNAGSAAVTSFVEAQVQPFFAGNAGLGNNVTIANTTDGFGQQGLAYYAWLKASDKELRPFVMYVVIEDGAPVVANVLVNKLVEGRHK